MWWRIWGLIQEETGAQCGTSFAGWSWDRTVGQVPYRTAGHLTGIATAPRKVIGKRPPRREGIGEGTCVSRRPCSAAHWGVSGSEDPEGRRQFRGLL